MIALRLAVALLWKRPQLALAWLCVLALPTLLGLWPVDVALAPHLDLRPAADALVAVPADDALWGELRRDAPALGGLAAGGLLVALLVGTPLLWLLAGVVAAEAIGPAAPRASPIARRALGIAFVALPVRALAWALAAGIALFAARAATFAALRVRAGVGIVLYALVAATITVVVDFARGHAIVRTEDGLARALRRGAALAWRQRDLAFVLVLLDLTSAAAAMVPAAASRPLGVYGAGGALAAFVALALRASAGVVGVAAAATGAASRSA